MRHLIVVTIFLLLSFSASSPLHADEDGWKFITDLPSLEDSARESTTNNIKWIVVSFFANWSLESNAQRDTRAIDPKEFPDYAFFKIDVTKSTKDVVLLEDFLKVHTVPTMLVLDKNLHEVEGTRISSYSLTSAQDARKWLRSVGTSSQVTTSPATVNINTEFNGNNRVAKLITDTNIITIRFAMPQGEYIYSDRISASINLVDVDRKKLQFSRKPEIISDVYFGKVAVYRDDFEIKLQKSDLRNLGCTGRGNLLLKYQFNSSENILFPQTPVYLNVDC